MYKTVYEAFQNSVAVSPDNAFLCVPPGRDFAPQGMELSYAQVARQVAEVASAYHAAGYGPGHRVALLLENRPDHFVHFLALNSLGVSQVPVNPDFRPEELRYLLDHSGADLLVCREFLADLGKAASAISSRHPSVVVAESWPSRLPEPSTKPKQIPGDASAEAALLYTSGTTARPKACILTNEHFMLFAQWYIDFGSEKGSYFALKQGEERLLNPLPVYHVAAGCLCPMTMMLTRGCLIMPGRFSAQRWWQEVVATRATLVHYIGLVPAALMNLPVVPEERMHRVKWGLGAGIEPSLHAAFEERFGFPNIEVWGMTEIARFTADDREPRRVGERAVGKPIRDFEMKIIDTDEKEVTDGSPGQLLVRSSGANPRHGFFAGYLNDPQATEEAWRGGWFHTGDVVRKDEDGMFYFVDRKKNIIRRSGENIAAGEIEAVLQADPAVAYAAAIAAPDEIRQEEIFACIVVQPGIVADAALAQRLFDLCMEKLAYYKAPGWLLFLDSLPLTQTQKVQKGKIFPEGQDPRSLPNVFDYRQLKRRKP
ncbi:MAG: AMP-binding protein [Sulfuricaulis sp.]|nr:AMP-binding protein [Sulfuricaulis sp.]